MALRVVTSTSLQIRAPKMKIDVRVLVLGVCMMISMTLMMTFLLLPHDDDKHFELDLQPSRATSQNRLPNNLTLSAGSSGNGSASLQIMDTVLGPGINDHLSELSRRHLGTDRSCAWR